MRKSKIRKLGFVISFCFLLALCFGGAEAFAAVTEGKPGNTYQGEYAVIVNTSLTEAESTGTLVFDSAVRSGTSKTEVADENQADSLLNTQTGQRQTAASAVTVYTVGQEKYIYHGSNINGKTYVCIGVGRHCYIWMEKGLKAQYDALGKTNAIAEDMADTYDGRPYEVLSDMCDGNIPYGDNSGKLSILLETLSSASGVYASDVGITAIHIATPDASAYTPGDMSSRNGLLVHEGQHALFEQLTGAFSNGEYLWINEGISVAAMDYLWGGTDSSGWLDYIAGNAAIRNGVSLIYQSYRDSTAQDYSMAYLFVRYLINRKTGGYNPMSFFPVLYQNSAVGIHSSEYVQKVLGEGTSFADVLTEFYTAVIAQEPGGKYGFQGDAVVYNKVSDYPLYMGESGKAHMLEKTGAIVLRLDNGAFTVPTDGGESIRYMIVGSKAVAVPSKGNGTAQNPYEISGIKDLNLMASSPNAYYKLTADITAGSQPYLTCTRFDGTLDGNGHTIRGLKQPLIGENHGTVRDLTIEAAIYDELRGVQGVFAKYNMGTISGCTVTGTARVKLAGELPAFGGITGVNELAGVVSGCGSSLDLELVVSSGTAWAGGIAGINTGSLEKIYHKGNISITGTAQSCKVNAAGIAGETRKFGGMGGVLKHCVNYGTISVTAQNVSAGQICGLINANIISSQTGINGHIKNCYGKAGGFPLIGSPAESEVSGSALLSEEQMKDSSNYEGWTFGSDWKMDDGGPVLTGSEDITSIETSGTPAFCYVGEIPYNWGQLRVNGASAAVPITESMISGFSSETAGYKTVTVTFKGKKTTFSIEVKRPAQVVLSGLSAKPKDSYSEGEYFNPAGATLRATIDGLPYRILYTGFDYDKKEPLTKEDTCVTFSYYGATIQYPITVKAAAPASLTVTSQMAKTKYQEGNVLDLSGVRVQITYNNKTKSPVFGADEFGKYGIRVAKTDSLNNTEAVSSNYVLGAQDNGARIYLYANDLLPGSFNAVAASVGNIAVFEKMKMEDVDLHVLQGGDTFISSNEISGGSGNYTTTVVKENLPSGLSRLLMPGGGCKNFSYRGVVTAPVGTYEMQYRITDTGTGSSILANIKIHVHFSNEVRMYSFTLETASNPSISKRVEGIIGENTILLKLPEGTDVTNLQPTIDYGSSMGTTCPAKYWNGSRHDFTGPVVYPLTAPDGVTKREYTVSVEFYGSEEKPENGTHTGSGAAGCSHKNTRWEKATAATCTRAGLEMLKCVQCKETLKTRPVPAAGHKPGKWTTQKQATIFATGIQVQRCGGCSAVLKRQQIAVKKATVKLNAASLPLQLKKSAAVLKIVQKDPADSVVSWTSSNKKVVTVNRNGKITAKKTGTAYVTVTMKSGAKASCKIKVQKKAVKTTGLTLPKTEIVLKAKKKYQITPIRAPLTSTDRITYKSSNKKVVTVTAKGKVTAKKKGTAKITVKAASGKKVILKITVK